MPAASPARVLVAEDNRADRLLLSAIVRSEGYHVVEAVDGCDAVEQFRTHRPHIVLLDALMPRMDGFEAARRIKAEAGERFVPVIFLSALGADDALLAAVEAGADDFLGKPYNQVILRAKLSALERLRMLHATMQRQRDEISRHHAHLVQEQEAAKAIFDKVAHTGSLDEPCIRYLISPLAVFNGDVLLAARNPAGNLYVLLGDFTGHGLTAAVGAMPLAEIFYGMSNKGFGPGDIVREANRKLGAMLPKGYFCCAALVALNVHKGTIEFWNGGLPSGCLFRAGRRELVHLESHHLPLGIQGDARFDSTTRVLEVEPGDRLILCTDGIVEARNDTGEAFGYERRDEIIRRTRPEESAFDALKHAVYAHMGASGRDDDITLVEVTVASPQQVPIAAPVQPVENGGGSEEWRLSYELGPRSLRSSNPLPLLQHVVTEFPQLRRHAGTIFTVLTELYSNALEHGLLRLDSSLKSSAAGFAEYYRARSRALVELDGFLRFDFRCEMDGAGGRLYITVTDSGPGFDYSAKLAELDAPREGEYHGRGLRLLRELCQSVSFRGRGNEVEVVFAWSGEHG
ncbi:MAG TPA: fused response regulator/phosphatase [Pseudomonadales bacterium]